MVNIIIQSLLNNLKVKNPNAYQSINNLMQSNGNPQMIIKQIMGNATPEQKQSLLKQAENYGAPKELLSKIQNMK